jgi:hypothetical protein
MYYVNQTLLRQLELLDIDFKYWVTIPWGYKQRNMDRCHSRHRELRRSLRAFYKEPIKIWFFNEVHTDTASRHCGGYHSHLLIEDCSPDRWKTPSKRMERFLSEKDPEALFNALSGQPVSDDSKQALLKRVLQLSPLVPSGSLGVVIKPIHDLRGLVGDYCLKQVGKELSISDVIDVFNSDLNLNNDSWDANHTRQKTLSL